MGCYSTAPPPPLMGSTAPHQCSSRGLAASNLIYADVRNSDMTHRTGVGGATEGGVRDILFEDVQVGSPDVVTSPWAIKFKVDTGALRNITFRRLRLGRIGDTPWMYVLVRARTVPTYFACSNPR